MVPNAPPGKFFQLRLPVDLPAAHPACPIKIE